LFAALCRFFAVAALLVTSTAEAQVPGYDSTESDAIVPAIAVPGWGVSPSPADLGYATEGPLPWHPRHRVLVAGAVALTAGYLAGLALGGTSVALDRGSGCDDALGGVQAVPVFGPIAAWIVSGMCRPQALDPLIHGFADIIPAIAQLAGFITLFVGVAGRRGGLASGPRVETTATGLPLTVAF